MNENAKQHRVILQQIAQRVMKARGLLPDFSAELLAELDRIQAPAPVTAGAARDLRDRLWCSIDNDDSMDLDQLTVAEAMPGDKVKLWVAVADVDALVKNGTAIDEHARHNTTSIYTAAEIFPMLPEKLSTNLTSLSFNEDRLAVVVEFVVEMDGSIQDAVIFKAQVRNRAKLAYNSVAAWLEGQGAVPDGVAAVQGLAENLHIQDQAAQRMKNFRHVHGALSLETIEAKAIFEGDEMSGLEAEVRNRAKELIEDCMIAANGVTARYLAARNFPSIRRVVRTPKRWDRIVEIAATYGVKLSDVPDSKALEDFLVRQKAADPVRFPDLSLSVIKLLGAGEYVAELPGWAAPGYFGLAVKDYAHSTAPNRRYTYLVTQRLLKAAIEGNPSPYSIAELEDLAAHCTEEEDVVNKVERQVGKSAAALLLQSRIGEKFAAIVTGASEKGTCVRLLQMPVEGKLMRGFEGLDVGDPVQVQLTLVDVEQGFIDFRKVG